MPRRLDAPEQNRSPQGVAALELGVAGVVLGVACLFHGSIILQPQGDGWSPVLLEGAVEGLERLEAARWRLDVLRPRACLGWRTPLAMDAALPRAYDLLDRSTFYEAALRAIQRAVHGTDKPRARRRAEREAIFQTLHRFHVVIRYRGGREIPLPDEGASS